MTTFTLPGISVGSALLSAAGIAALGALTLGGGRSRPRGALAFGFFASLWGAQIVFANLATAANDAATADLLYRVSIGLLIPLPYLLLEFAASQVPRGSNTPLWHALRVAVAGGALAAVTLFYFDPAAIYRGVVSTPRGYTGVWGEWLPLLVPLFHTFSLTLAVLWFARRGAATPRIGRQASTLLAGLGMWAAFVSSKHTIFFLDNYARNRDPTTLPYLIDHLVLAIVSVGVVAFLLLERAKSRDVAQARVTSLVAAALVLPFAAGVVEGFLMIGPYPGLHTVGIWRLAGVAVIAYGLARWWNFDLAQRTVRATASASGVAGSAAGGAAAYGVGTLVLPGILGPAAVALAVFGASLVPMVRFTQRLFRRAARVEGVALEETLYGQRVDTYRAALEAALARGSLEEDEEFLSSLRERFTITEAEHRLLLYYAKSSVLVPRAEGPNAAYERLRLLGEGGGGRTWLARDRVRDRLVVLKEPLSRWQSEPRLRDIVLREARLAAKVRHPNVVHIEEIVEHDGVPVIVMEYLEGGSLLDVLRARGTLPWKEGVATLVGVLRGLDAVHSAGIIHRDVKPSNILIDGDGNPKLSDFGVALPDSPERTQMDVSHSLSGTLTYMAPEVAGGATAGDRLSDLWSCAALLHECVYGAPPAPQAVLYKAEGVPQRLTEILAKGLAKERERRFQSARAFADALGKVIQP